MLPAARLLLIAPAFLLALPRCNFMRSRRRTLMLMVRTAGAGQSNWSTMPAGVWQSGMAKWAGHFVWLAHDELAALRCRRCLPALAAAHLPAAAPPVLTATACQGDPCSCSSLWCPKLRGPQLRGPHTARGAPPAPQSHHDARFGRLAAAQERASRSRHRRRNHSPPPACRAARSSPQRLQSLWSLGPSQTRSCSFWLATLARATWGPFESM